MRIRMPRIRTLRTGIPRTDIPRTGIPRAGIPQRSPCVQAATTPSRDIDSHDLASVRLNGGSDERTAAAIELRARTTGALDV